MTTLHVRFVSPRATVGCPERIMLDLLAALDRSAISPSVCFLEDGPLVGYCRDTLRVPTSLVPARPHRPADRRRASRTIAQLLAAEGVEVVHSLTPLGHLVGGRAAKRARRPAVWSQLAAPSFKHSTEVRAALLSAKGIVVSTRAVEAAQRRFNPRKVPIAVVQPGTTIPTQDAAVRRARARAALGLADGEFAAGVLARLGPGQGHETFLRAGATLCRARADAKLVLIGAPISAEDRAFDQGLRKLIQSLGIGSRVLFPGFCNDLAECLSALDVAVYAATRERYYPLQVVEAMAAGTALVAAETADVAEIVTGWKNGILYPPDDHEALAASLLMLHDDPERRARLSAESARAAAARFDAAVAAQRLTELYASVSVKV